MIKIPAFRRRQTRDHHRGASTFTKNNNVDAMNFGGSSSSSFLSSYHSVASISDHSSQGEESNEQEVATYGPPAVEQLYEIEDIETGDCSSKPIKSRKKFSNPEGLIVPAGTFA